MSQILNKESSRFVSEHANRASEISSRRETQFILPAPPIRFVITLHLSENRLAPCVIWAVWLFVHMAVTEFHQITILWLDLICQIMNLHLWSSSFTMRRLWDWQLVKVEISLFILKLTKLLKLWPDTDSIFSCIPYNYKYAIVRSNSLQD